jgi:hypothetical protein
VYSTYRVGRRVQTLPSSTQAAAAASVLSPSWRFPFGLPQLIHSYSRFNETTEPFFITFVQQHADGVDQGVHIRDRIGGCFQRELIGDINLAKIKCLLICLFNFTDSAKLREMEILVRRLSMKNLCADQPR